MIRNLRLLTLGLLTVAAGVSCQRTPPAADTSSGVRVETIDGALRYPKPLIVEKTP